MRFITFCTLLTFLTVPAAYSGEVEVLHYWTSGGEAASVAVLKESMAKDGHLWNDFIVEGGGGANAMASLQSRVLKGKPPTAAQIKGLDIQRWGRLGFLANLDDQALNDGWDDVLPKIVADAMKHKGKYVAVPVNVHRTNWLWVNKPLLDQLKLKVPKTWKEFDAAAKVISENGYDVLASGDQDWQLATLFETVALSVGGPEFYNKAFVQHEFSSMKSKTMERIFTRYYKLLKMTAMDPNKPEWNQATDAVIRGQAAFQIMGDWAKGEFANAGKVPDFDYLCEPVPGTANMFLFNIDSFAMFRLKKEDLSQQGAQADLVKNIMNESFQRTFNVNKGSIPARTDISKTGFDLCARHSMDEFQKSNQQGSLLPSIAHGMATTGTVQSYFYKKIGELSRAPKDPRTSSKELAKAIRYGQLILK